MCGICSSSGKPEYIADLPVNSRLHVQYCIRSLWGPGMVTYTFNPTLKRKRQRLADLWGFKASLIYTMSFKANKLNRPCLKIKKFMNMDLSSVLNLENYTNTVDLSFFFYDGKMDCSRCLKIISMVSLSAEQDTNKSVIQIVQLRPQNYAFCCVMEARCGGTPCNPRTHDGGLRVRA